MQIVTVSREFGSGGREVGKRLADALGFRYYDKEILSGISEKLSLDEQYIEHTLQRGLSPNFPVTFGRTFYPRPNIIRNDEINVLVAQQQIIRELAQYGDCVMVGRSSNIILQEYHSLNLFVYADMPSKIKRCQERAPESETLTVQELEKKIRQIDSGRAKHQKMLSDQKWGQKEGYHLCVNTTGIEIKSMIPAIEAFARCWFGMETAKK